MEQLAIVLFCDRTVRTNESDYRKHFYFRVVNYSPPLTVTLCSFAPLENILTTAATTTTTTTTTYLTVQQRWLFARLLLTNEVNETFFSATKLLLFDFTSEVGQQLNTSQLTL